MGKVFKCQIISQPKIYKFVVDVRVLHTLLGYSKRSNFQVTAAHFHAATQTFVPLIDSIIDDTLLQSANQTTRQSGVSPRIK